MTSKLKQDRNYQPPRIKKPIIQRERTLTRQETIKSTDEYNDDFEDDEEISVKGICINYVDKQGERGVNQMSTILHKLTLRLKTYLNSI